MVLGRRGRPDVRRGGFLGASGLLMWWQMKKLRPWGLVTLIVSAAVATLMAVGMHDVLATRL